MAYKVHRLELDIDEEQEVLEDFLNSLEGEVVSILPHLRSFSFFQIYGAGGPRIDFVLIIEKLCQA